MNRTAPAILPPAVPRAALDYAESFATPATRRAILKAEAELACLDAMQHGAAPFPILTRTARHAFTS
jgi:hypothetical protein